MELEQCERETFEGRAALSRSSTLAQRLQNQFGPLVPLEHLTTQVEWSCHESVANILRGARKVVGLTNSIKSWRQHNPKKRLPLLQFGSFSSAFHANVNEDRANFRKEALIAAFRELAVEAGVNPNDKPRGRAEEPQTPDLTIINNGNVHRSNYYCSLQRNDTLEQPLFLPDFQHRSEFEASSGVGFPHCRDPAGEFSYRQVALLVLANALGAPSEPGREPCRRIL